MGYVVMPKNKDTAVAIKVESNNTPYIPNDVLNHIGSFITNTKSKAAFAQTSKYFNRLFQPDLDKTILEYAIDSKPREKEILGMLEINPGLITKYGEITDKSNRRIGGTIYRILIATHNPLWKKIETYFKKIQDGEKERKKQVNEQFPSGYDPNARKKYDIHGLISVIIDDLSIRFYKNTLQFQMNKATELELQNFITYYTPKENEIITTGLHFDPFIYIDILEAYAKRVKDFKNLEQRALYGCLVEGGIQTLFTTYFAKLTCKGIRYAIENLETLDDSKLNTGLKDGSDFFSPRLGVTHFVYSYDSYADVWGPETYGRGSGLDTNFVSYAKKVQQILESLYSECNTVNFCKLPSSSQLFLR